MHIDRARLGLSRHRRFRLATLATAALPVAALATALLAAPAAGASVHAGPATTGPATTKPAPLVWHPLTLVHGWKSASTKLLDTGTPAWATQGGVVYLRGAVEAPASSFFAYFSVLPAAERPAHNLYLQVYSTGGAPGTLYIGANGDMEAYDGGGPFTSLSAVSFPTAAVASKTLALENGWVSSQSAYDTGNPAYAVKGGVVYLSGSMHTSGKSKLAFVLPKAARPARDLYIPEYAFDATTGWLQILPTGQVYINGASSDEYISLGNISFPVASTKWTYFKLIAPWVPDASQAQTGSPAYAVINQIVYLSGSMRQPTASNGLWVRLPVAARTKADVLEIETDTAGGTSGAIAITNSLGLASSNPFSNARAFTSLGAIAYPQNS